MALFLRVRDNRWQFSFGSKYMVIADVAADPGTTAVAGGTPISISNRDPQVKASRAPWFSVFSSAVGLQAFYIPSDYGKVPPGQFPSTTEDNANDGKLVITQDGTEVTGDLSTLLTNAGSLSGLFIFQGME